MKIVTITATVDGKLLKTWDIRVFGETVDLKDIGNFLADIGDALKQGDKG